MLVRNSTHKNTRKRLVCNSGHSKVNGKHNPVKAGSQFWTQQQQKEPRQSWLAILDTAKSTAKRTTSKAGLQFWIQKSQRQTLLSQNCHSLAYFNIYISLIETYFQLRSSRRRTKECLLIKRTTSKYNLSNHKCMSHSLL